MAKQANVPSSLETSHRKLVDAGSLVNLSSSKILESRSQVSVGSALITQNAINGMMNLSHNQEHATHIIRSHAHVVGKVTPIK